MSQYSFLVVILLLIGIIFLRMKDRQSLERQQQELDQYTRDIESVYQKLKGIRHDYRNHLQVMVAYTSEKQYEQLENYVQQLLNEINRVDTLIQTGNTLIDALVNTKLTVVKDKGVLLNVKAIAPRELAIESLDLAIILGNLLTNAVEATTRYPHDHSFIRLYIAPMNQTLYIHLTNSMAISPKKQFLSLKAVDRQGYGIKRIDETVKKYNGIVNRQFEEGVFSTEITLPI